MNDALLARHKAKKQQELDRCRRRFVLATLVCMVVAITASLQLDLADPIPMHTSVLTGQAWLDELITGHHRRFREALGMAKHVFLQLSIELQMFHGLRPSKFVSANEKLAIFLHMARTGSSTRMLQEQFQRSGDTISKYGFFLCIIPSLT
jgi:hypothetical protein